MARVVPLFEMDETGVKRFTTLVAAADRSSAPADTAAAPSALRR